MRQQPPRLIAPEFTAQRAPRPSSLNKRLDLLVLRGVLSAAGATQARGIWGRENKAIHETPAGLADVDGAVEELCVVLHALSGAPDPPTGEQG